MRIAVQPDIHANRQAFEAVLEEVASTEVDEIWCLGDVVGYGADPDACCALPRTHCDVSLVGNHDLAVRGYMAIDESSRGAAVATEWTRDVTDTAPLEWLRG